MKINQAQYQTLLLDDGQKVNYVQQGGGMPVILTHGLAASLHDWDDLIPEVAAAGYAGYAPDLLGHGESEKPREHHLYSVENVYDHFAKWIDALRIDRPMVLVGHSLGGGLSMMYALRNSKRVKGLVLINPFYSIRQLPGMLQLMFRRRLLNTKLIDLTPYRVFRMLVDVTSFNFYIGHREAHVLPEHIRYQTALDYKRASSGIYNIPRTPPGADFDITRLHQPTLLLWGNRDQTLDPASFPKLAARIPNLKGTHAFPICGHVPHQCHPQDLNPHVMDFLAGL